MITKITRTVTRRVAHLTFFNENNREVYDTEMYIYNNISEAELFRREQKVPREDGIKLISVCIEAKGRDFLASMPLNAFVEHAKLEPVKECK